MPTKVPEEHNWVVPPIDWSSIPRQVLDRMKEYTDVPDYDAPIDPSTPGESHVEVERRFHPERFVEGGMHYRPNLTTTTPIAISARSVRTHRQTQAPVVEKNTPTAVILFGLLALAVFTLVLIVSYRTAFRSSRLKTKKALDDIEMGKLKKPKTKKLTHAKASELPPKLNPTYLTGFHEIAEGQFSVICSAVYRDTDAVAVKKAKPEFNDLINKEMTALKLAGKHRNIVALLGSFEENGNLCLVLEFSYYGDLSSYLIRKRPVPVTPSSVYQNAVPGQQDHLRSEDLWLWCNQILDALIHLSDLNIIHGDVAARNVLVFNHHLVKLCDFGLSHIAKSVNVFTTIRESMPLPIAWMPPEAVTRDRHEFSQKTDVWSFGVYMWEVFSLGRKPYEGFPVAEIPAHVRSGARLAIPDTCRDISANYYWYELMLLTWIENPEERPTFATIRGFLKSKNLYNSDRK